MDAKIIRQGNTIFIEYEVRDLRTVDEPLVDPSSLLLHLTDPEGTVVLDNVAMTRRSLGRYEYEYQTTTASPVGIWIAYATAMWVGRVGITLDEALFNLVAS